MQKRKLIVIKIGSNTLTTSKGELDTANLSRIVGEVAAQIKKNGRNFIVVSSGAIVSGASRLGLKFKPSSIPEKQAAAAVGQTLLMKEYEKAFAKYKINVAQVLLTKDAFSNAERHANARNALSTLLKMGVVPVINENDAVATDEIKVGDNDNLSALVARLVGADLLVNLTSVDGFYEKIDGIEKKLISVITKINAEIEKAAKSSGSDHGTGGMVTKLQAAKICQEAGIPMVIASGRKKGIITNLFAGKIVGTLFAGK
jgi:glutamate 5-kinase